MKKVTEQSQTNSKGSVRHAERSRSIVKTSPIVKDKKWYKVGDNFPYNPTTDKKLLWNLVDISENKIPEIFFKLWRQEISSFVANLSPSGALPFSLVKNIFYRQKS